MLYRIAGDKSPALGLAGEEDTERAEVADAWRGWWKAAAPTADLGRINIEKALQGINVIGEWGNPDGGRVWACRADGKPLWEIKDVAGPVDVQLLPNGHVLIAECRANRVTERDHAGKIVWSKNVNPTLTTCRRLPNGNTFIATYVELMEVDPKGTPLYSYKNPFPGEIFRAHRFPNGHLLFTCPRDRIVELDAKGKLVRTVNIPAATGAFNSVESLPGGRFLVAVREANKVIEIDTAGKILWECKTTDPTSVVRLPNGNTLVACYGGVRTVIEFDRTGKEVWQLKLGLVFCIRRY